MFDTLINRDIAKNQFFFIDSSEDVLNRVQTHLYGYYVDESGVIDGKTSDKFDFIEDKHYGGSYVFVRRSENAIEVMQDYSGTYGLFLFRKDNYWAISNSFVLLVDKIKTRYTLTLNEDYAGASLFFDMSHQLSLNETFITEIELLPRIFKVIIDLNSKQLELEMIKYDDFSVPIDSAEGISILDNWARKWINIINSFDKSGEAVLPLQVDLSGGFDSRLTFALFTISGLDLNRIKVYSHLNFHGGEAARRGLREDYAIASEIAKFYGFTLNNQACVPKTRPMSPKDIISIFFNAKLGFHEVVFAESDYWETPFYRFGGAGGETLRKYYEEDNPQNFIKNKMLLAAGCKTSDMAPCINRVLQRTFDNLEKYFDKDVNMGELRLIRFYKEVGSRNHFGRCMVEAYPSNKFYMSPLSDYDISKIKMLSETNADAFLLFALVLVRYQKELLNFRFQGGRSYRRETLEEAERINAKYPLPADLIRPRRHSSVAIPIVEEKFTPTKENTPMKYTEEILFQIFKSPEFKSAFTEHFTEELYVTALNFANNRKEFVEKFKLINPIIAVTKMLMDTKISRYLTQGIEEETAEYNRNRERQAEMQSKKISLLLELFQTARIEFVNSANRKAEFGIASLDESVPVYSLMGVGGVQSGYMLRSSAKHLKVRLQSQRDDNLVIVLRGNGLSGKNNEFISLPVDFTYLSINGQSVFPDKVVTAHFNNPCAINFRVQRGVIYEFDIRWNVHGYSDEEFMKLLDTAWKDKLIYNYV